jgi:hypothetical protein
MEEYIHEQIINHTTHSKAPFQAQYAHKICSIKVFGLVYKPTYGDINATAVNTLLAGSAEIASVSANQKITSKALIGEIQALVGSVNNTFLLID